MTEKPPFTRIARYYDALVARHGHSPRACDYGRAESQQRKFAVLADVMPMQQRSILDVGCGFADYAAFLEARYPGVAYSGIDISPSMIAEASRSRPDLQLRQLDILAEDPGTFDIVSANGIFYLLGERAPQLMTQLIERMFALSRLALAFNSLSAWTEDPEPDEYYADPLATLELCRRLTPWVVLRHDYHARDFTIFMYRQRT